MDIEKGGKREVDLGSVSPKKERRPTHGHSASASFCPSA